ncbi:hypothetical protein [Variovorax sp. UMC13]|uniref:hypothetical protein n=1 Tax=Variovorax sp. UMC13 TaxID=1862326 RepID=UPI0015FF95B1|nr:hypothetical protein [Variovorax sp. UMC13]
MNNAAWLLVGGLLGWGLSFALAYWRETRQPVTLHILLGAVVAGIAQWAVRGF